MIFTPSPLLDLLLLGTMLLFVLHYLIERKRAHWVLMDPFNAFWGVVFVCYVFQPVGFYAPLAFHYSEAGLIETQCWVLFGMIFVMIGYHWKWAPRWGVKLPNMPRSLQPGMLSACSWLLIACGLVGYVIQIQTAPSLEAWLSKGRGGTDYTVLSGYFTVLDAFLPVGITILLFRVELIKCGGVLKSFVWSLAGLQWLWFVYLGTRSRTIMFLLTIGCAYYLPRRKNPHWALLAVVAPALLLLVNFQAYYRGTFTNLSFHLENLEFKEVMQTILPHALGGKRGENTGQSLGDLEYNCVAAVVNIVPKFVPYNHGYTLLEVATHGVPRYFWPNKIYPLYEAQSPVMEMGNLSRHWYETANSRFLVGPAFTYIGYWYHAGGAIGLMLGGLFTGTFLRMIRTYLDRDFSNQGNFILYVLLLPIGFSEAASTPFYWMFWMPLFLVPTILFLFFAKEHGEDADYIPHLVRHGMALT